MIKSKCARCLNAVQFCVSQSDRNLNISTSQLKHTTKKISMLQSHGKIFDSINPIRSISSGTPERKYDLYFKRENQNLRGRFDIKIITSCKMLEIG